MPFPPVACLEFGRRASDPVIERGARQRVNRGVGWGHETKTAATLTGGGRKCQKM